MVLTQHVAGILTQETLDALAEFLDPIHLVLAHAPGAVGSVRRPGPKRRDHLVDLVVPRDIRHQVLDDRERLHRLKLHRGIWRQGVHARHAHEARLAVDLGRARATFARLAVPATGQVVGLRGLDLVYRVEHHHPLGDLALVRPKLSPGRIASPYQEGHLTHCCLPKSSKLKSSKFKVAETSLLTLNFELWNFELCHFISSMTLRSSSGIGLVGSRRTFMQPSGLRCTMMLLLPNSSLLVG